MSTLPPPERRIRHAELIDLLRYDCATGVFRWRYDDGRRADVGVARTQHRIVKVRGEIYRADFLEVFYLTGQWPPAIVSVQTAHPHVAPPPRVRSYIMRRGKHGKWSAHISIDGKCHFLGRFDCKLDAQAEYVWAQDNLHLFRQESA